MLHINIWYHFGQSDLFDIKYKDGAGIFVKNVFKPLIRVFIKN